MAVPVYSTRFILRASVVGPQSFAVPPGYLAVVRDVDVTTEPTGGCNVLLFVGGALLWIVELGLEPQFTYQAWRGRAVANALDIIELDTTDTASGHVSGYLLTSP